MAEKRVSVRLAAVGGDRVKAEFEGIGKAGRRGFRKVSREAEIANAKLARFVRRASIAAGIKPRDAVRALAEAPQVPGRMEKVGSRDGASVFVDYAHTPDALVNAIAALRESSPRRLITVFGCGGDRDVTKRPLMGKAAAEGSDYCIVTSDNPRSEDPETIIADVEKGMVGKRYESIPDRMKAIQTAVNLSGEGDIILIAGKGHEPYQEIAGNRIEFDDRRAAYKALNFKSTTDE